MLASSYILLVGQFFCVARKNKNIQGDVVDGFNNPSILF